MTALTADISTLNLTVNDAELKETVHTNVQAILAQLGVTPPITAGIVQGFAGRTDAFDGVNTAFTSIPSGWLPCDGRRLNQTATPDARETNGTLSTAALFAAVGHSFEQPLEVLPDGSRPENDLISLPFHHFTNGQEVKVRTVDAAGVWSADPMDPSYYVARVPDPADPSNFPNNFLPHVLVLHTSIAMAASIGLDAPPAGSHLVLISPDTFALPDLRGRIPLGAGSSGIGSGSRGQEEDLTSRPLGSLGGEEQHTLTAQELPSANVKTPIRTNTGSYGRDTRFGVENIRPHHGVYGGFPAQGAEYPYARIEGGNQPHNNMPPFQAMYHIIHA